MTLTELIDTSIRLRERLGNGDGTVMLMNVPLTTESITLFVSSPDELAEVAFYTIHQFNNQVLFGHNETRNSQPS